MLSLISHYHRLSIKWRSLFSSIQRKELFSFVVILFMVPLHFITLIFRSCFYLHCYFEAYYMHFFALPPRPPSMLCLQLGHSPLLLYGLCLHLISPSSCLNPAAGELCGALVLAAIQNLIGMSRADFNLVTLKQWAPSGGSCGSRLCDYETSPVRSSVYETYQLPCASAA